MKTFDGTPIATIRNAETGIHFTMRLVRPGDGYGRDLARINDSGAPMVEFYDARYCCERTQEKGGEYGQFVSRYYAETFQNHGPFSLCLDGGVDAWNLDRAAMEAAQTIVANWLA